jgi:hypothetical protein
MPASTWFAAIFNFLLLATRLDFGYEVEDILLVSGRFALLLPGGISRQSGHDPVAANGGKILEQGAGGGEFGDPGERMREAIMARQSWRSVQLRELRSSATPREFIAESTSATWPWGRDRWMRKAPDPEDGEALGSALRRARIPSMTLA